MTTETLPEKRAQYLPCKSCGDGVPVPEFNTSTPEGLLAWQEFQSAVANVEGCHPEFCEGCEATYSKIRPPTKNLHPGEPEVVTQFRGVTQNGLGGIKGPDGKIVKVDSFSASAFIAIYDAVNDENKKKILAYRGGAIPALCSLAFKLINKRKDN